MLNVPPQDVPRDGFLVAVSDPDDRGLDQPVLGDCPSEHARNGARQVLVLAASAGKVANRCWHAWLPQLSCRSRRHIDKLEELREEIVEIALYSLIETLATEVGDRDTARLAVTIRRDEERMARYLSAELPRLVKALVRAEIPREQRAPRSRTTRTRASTAKRRRREPRV